MNTNIRWLGMSGGSPFVPRKQSVRLGQFLLVLSFFLPYLFANPGEESFYTFMMYAPIWVLQLRSGILYGGPSPMALLMFQFWIPYALIGYQAYRYAKGRISSEKSYLLSIILLTVIAIILTLPLSFIPTGSTTIGDIYTAHYTIAIPLPIITVLALLSVRLLAPTKVEVPWTEEAEISDTVPDEESVWTD